jgi:hypothetical protein
MPERSLEARWSVARRAVNRRDQIWPLAWLHSIELSEQEQGRLGTLSGHVRDIDAAHLMSTFALLSDVSAKVLSSHKRHEHLRDRLASRALAVASSSEKPPSPPVLGFFPYRPGDVGAPLPPLFWSTIKA